MKTLDEVIKAWSICFSDNSRSNCTGCPYADDDGEGACFNHDREDALHYLKELKLFRQTPIMQGIHKAQRECALYHVSNFGEDEPDFNPPLTWDELKTMEGKPVWVEVFDPIDEKSGWHTTFWSLIEFINDEYICLRDNDGEQQCYQKKSTTWRAYRKERK